MSTLLSARNLSKSFPANDLFEGVGVHIETGDRVGLIGPNGAGKSTLLSVLAGLQTADAGEVIARRSLSLVYMDQSDHFPEGMSVLECVLAALPGSESDRLDARTRASRTLSQLGFDNTMTEQTAATLSGGWRKRLSLARALAQEPELLFLDEPTNHLDLEGVQWLEQFVRKAQMAIVTITHDRAFLENTSTRVIELSPAYPGGTFETNGNYSEFLRRKNAFLDAQAQAQAAIANAVRRDTAWLEQGIQGRQTRNKTQVERATTRRAELKASEGRTSAPKQRTTIDFQATERKTKKLLGLHAIAISRGGRQLFAGLDVQLSPGQRVGLIGPNGSGKTTLLRIMNGELEPDSGTIKRAADLSIVTFSQERERLNRDCTLHEALCPVGDMVDYRGKPVHVSGWAKRFLFTPDQLATRVAQLSGGEQARVLIANLMLDPADVLLLDEPTNDLDIPSLEVLEDALLEFPGAIVLVTHDRFMMERLASEYIALDGIGGIHQVASLAQWKTRLKRVTPQAKASKKKSANRVNTSKKLSYNEQRELDGMEATIDKAVTDASELEAKANNPKNAQDHTRASDLFQQLAVAQERITTLYTRWQELESKRP